MGIDCYLIDPDSNKVYAEETGQTDRLGFNTLSGDAGYLREAYHGGPYATQVLLEEGWNDGDMDGEGNFEISASILRKRLPQTLKDAAQRNKTNYDGDLEKEVLKSFKDFVELAEKLEKERGKPCKFYVSY
jgi:hypothetical protein